MKSSTTERHTERSRSVSRIVRKFPSPFAILILKYFRKNWHNSRKTRLPIICFNLLDNFRLFNTLFYFCNYIQNK